MRFVVAGVVLLTLIVLLWKAISPAPEIEEVAGGEKSPIAEPSSPLPVLREQVSLGPSSKGLAIVRVRVLDQGTKKLAESAWIAASLGDRVETRRSAQAEFEAAPGAVAVIAGAPGFAPALSSIATGGGTEDAIEIQLQRLGRIDLSVRERGSGAPVNGTALLAPMTSEYHHLLLVAQTAIEGDDLPPLIPRLPPTEIVASEIPFTLDDAQRLLIETDNAALVEKLSITARRLGHTVQGAISFDAVAPTEWVLLFWSDGPFTDACTTIGADATPLNSVTLEVERAWVLEGHVTFEGRPLENAELKVWGARSPTTGHVQQRTNGEGAFRIPMNQDRMSVLVRLGCAPDGSAGKGFAAYREVEFAAGESTRTVDVDLGERSTTASGFVDVVRGVVLDERGEPIVDAKVRVGFFGPLTTTDQKGRFELWGLEGLPAQGAASESLEVRRRDKYTIEVGVGNHYFRHSFTLADLTQDSYLRISETSLMNEGKRSN